MAIFANDRTRLEDIRQRLKTGADDDHYLLTVDDRSSLIRLLSSELDGGRFRARFAGNQLKKLPLADQVEHLEFMIEELTGVTPLENELPDYERLKVKGLSRQEARFAAAVLAKRGKLVTKDMAMAAVFWDRSSDEWPDQQCLTVLACRGRQKMIEADEAYIPVWYAGTGWVATPV